jgi:hypothetical protein
MIEEGNMATVAPPAAPEAGVQVRSPNTELTFEVVVVDGMLQGNTG